jgi:hypothetical protein
MVVIVVRPLVPGREHECVDAECGDPERLSDLAEPVALAKLVE